ncbi:DUF5667 domain-containing protein [Candidatus Margulisiibacteriota bacterium]
MKPDYEIFDELLNDPKAVSDPDKKQFKDFLTVSKKLKNNQEPEIDKVAMAQTILDVEKTAQRKRIINDLIQILNLRNITTGFSKLIRDISSFNPMPRLAYRAIAILLIVILSISTVSMSIYANPGDFFYPIKLITEKISYLLHFNKEGKLELNITFSEARMKELLANFKESGKIDREILNIAIKEAQRALSKIDDLEEDKKNIFKEKIVALNKTQYEILTNLDKKVGAEDKAAITNAIDQCSRMMSGQHRRNMMHQRNMYR